MYFKHAKLGMQIMEEINIKQFCMEAQIQYDIWICMNMGILENLLIIRQYSLGDAAQHLFFSCRVSYAMWNRCYLWVVLNSVLHNEANSHFLQHSIWGINKKSNDMWKVTWFAVIWSIWLHRNAILYLRRSCWMRRSCGTLLKQDPGCG